MLKGTSWKLTWRSTLLLLLFLDIGAFGGGFVRILYWIPGFIVFPDLLKHLREYLPWNLWLIPA